jgi:hypothetical protein
MPYNTTALTFAPEGTEAHVSVRIASFIPASGDAPEPLRVTVNVGNVPVFPSAAMLPEPIDARSVSVPAWECSRY